MTVQVNGDTGEVLAKVLHCSQAAWDVLGELDSLPPTKDRDGILERFDRIADI